MLSRKEQVGKDASSEACISLTEDWQHFASAQTAGRTRDALLYGFWQLSPVSFWELAEVVIVKLAQSCFSLSQSVRKSSLSQMVRR